MECRNAMLKRMFDIVVAAIGLVLLGPVLLVVALLVAMRLGRPVLFIQRRPGLHGAIFPIWKFRTMTNAVDHDGNLLPDELRLTRFGRFLRRSSLDELPELVNVLKGEMSLVGPRPMLVEYLPLYSAEQARRHDVRPGITGLAQISGRNAIAWEEKFALDVWYVDNRSFRLDLAILTRTVLKVLGARDIDEQGRVGQTKFSGAPRTGDE